MGYHHKDESEGREAEEGLEGGGGAGPRHHRHTQRPLTSPGRRTDEAGSSQ